VARAIASSNVESAESSSRTSSGDAPFCGP